MVIPTTLLRKKNFIFCVNRVFFVEWAKVHGYEYGTPQQVIEKACREGKIPITDLDIQGAKKVKEYFPQSQSIFILPPSLEELRQRVLKRDGEATPDLQCRLDNAQKEIDSAQDFDFQFTNRNFSASYEVFKQIVQKIIDHFKNLD